jgi:hypothetical protein
MIVITKKFKTYVFSRNLNLFFKESTLFPREGVFFHRELGPFIKENSFFPKKIAYFPREFFLLHRELAWD